MMEQERFEDFVVLIGAISKEIQRIKAAEAAKLGLKGADIMLLYQLHREPEGLTSAELARRAGVTRAAISRYTAGLEERGFIRMVEDERSGRYRARLYLTEQGVRAMDEAVNTIARVVAQAGDELSAEDRQVMYRSLATVLDRLKHISRNEAEARRAAP